MQAQALSRRTRLSAMQYSSLGVGRMSLAASVSCINGTSYVLRYLRLWLCTDASFSSVSTVFCSDRKQRSVGRIRTSHRQEMFAACYICT
ncbi:hypothetical protein OH76DRAFT_1406316, partial [Lentinus brumalis]